MLNSHHWHLQLRVTKAVDAALSAVAITTIPYIKASDSMALTNGSDIDAWLRFRQRRRLVQ
jgi:hypothetical protein